VDVFESPAQTVLNGSCFDEAILIFVCQGKMIDCSRSPNSLVIILRMEFIKEINLKSFTTEGLLTLSTIVMKELLMA
jgi:hypothetical protein